MGSGGIGVGQPSKLYYGWVIVGILCLAQAMGMAMGGLNFGIFIKPMGDDLGIGRAAFGWAQSARQVASAASSPHIGRLIDRYGVRVLLPVTVAIGALCLVGLANVREEWQLIALFGLMGLVGMVGPGALITTVPIAKWFVRYRGRAMSFATLGNSIGGVLFVPLTAVLIETQGWRNAWVILAALGSLVIIPVALAFLRRSPEDMGLQPDGDAAPAASTGVVPGAHAAEISWTLAEVRGTRTFWQLVFVFSVVVLGSSTVGVHRLPGFMDRGIDPILVSYATALDAAAASISMVGLGFVFERYQVRYAGAVSFLLMACATLLTIFAFDAPMMFAATLVWGLGIGGNLLLGSYIWAQYYGRQNLGAIRGIVQPVTLVFSGIGAPAAGYVRDLTGSYDGVWWVGVCLMLTGAVVLAVTPRPRHASLAS